MILVSYGTRPELIKLQPIIKKLGSKCRVLFTGQHEDLADFGHDYVIRIYGIGNRLDAIVSSIMGKMTYILENEPWITHVMVQGDTTSALAVALSAFHHGLKIIHLEAGLRTGDLRNPYPEEGNRKMISQIANIHLCPTTMNAAALHGVGGTSYIVGNTAIDNLVKYKSECEYTDIVLVTMHRRENHAKMRDWFEEIENLATLYYNIKFILPMHPNPDVKKHANIFKNVVVVNPMSHEALLSILVKAKLVITDSGGLQEECSYFNKKCLVCRKVTERRESILISSFMVYDPSMLKGVFDVHINDYELKEKCPYGDGNSAEEIYKILTKELINEAILDRDRQLNVSRL